MLYIASTAPAAPSVWPVFALVEANAGRVLNNRIIARLSVSSLFSVAVPCAFMKLISVGSRPATLNAALIDKKGPSPSSDIDEGC